VTLQSMLVAIDVASPQIVELLLLHGADCGKPVEAVSYWGQPLHRALYSHKCPRESYKQMFRLLVQATVCAPLQHHHQQQQSASQQNAVCNWHLPPSCHFNSFLSSSCYAAKWTKRPNLMSFTPWFQELRRAYQHS